MSSFSHYGPCHWCDGVPGPLRDGGCGCCWTVCDRCEAEVHEDHTHGVRGANICEDCYYAGTDRCPECGGADEHTEDCVALAAGRAA